MSPELLTSIRELHSRVTDGIQVRMLWRGCDNAVFVTVDDHKTGDALSIEVQDRTSALDVFHHPFAYAA